MLWKSQVWNGAKGKLLLFILIFLGYNISQMFALEKSAHEIFETELMMPKKESNHILKSIITHKQMMKLQLRDECGNCRIKTKLNVWSSMKAITKDMWTSKDIDVQAKAQSKDSLSL